MDIYTSFDKINRDLPLQNEIKRGILPGYPLKGGTYGRCDRRVIHRRGGSSEAEASSRYSKTPSANRRVNWLQNLEGMASQTVRPGQVYGRQDQQTAGVKISFSVAHPWPVKFLRLSSHGVRSRYLVVYFLILRLASPVRKDEIRQGVAWREYYA